MVPFFDGRLTRRTRNSNHLVAAGPKMTGEKTIVLEKGGCIGERAVKEGGMRTSTVCSHATCPHEILVGKAASLYTLLGHCVASGEEHLSPLSVSCSFAILLQT